MEQSEQKGGTIPHLPDWDWFLDCLRQDADADAEAKQDEAASLKPLHEGGSSDWIIYM